MTKTYPAGALVRLDDIVRKPDGTPGLLPISASTWANWVKDGRVPKGELLGKRMRVWKIEDVLAAGYQTAPELA